MKSIIAFGIIFILIANLINKKLVEYSLIPFLLCMFYLAQSKMQGFSWKGLFPKTGFDWLFLVWFGILVVGHTVNGTWGKHEYTEVTEYRWFLAVYFIAAAMMFASVTEKGVKWFAVASSALCAFYIVHFYLKPPVDSTVFGLPNRMTGLLESPTDFGHAVQFLFILFVVVLVSTWTTSSRSFKILLGSAALLSGINLYLSFTRISWIASLVSIFLFVAIYYRRYFLKMFAGTLIVLGSAYWLNLGGFKDRVLFSLNPEQSYDENRILLWKFNWSLFKDNPVFGVGYHHNFVKFHSGYDVSAIPERYHQAHAHNQILNFLGGTGVIGAIWYVAIMVAFGVLSYGNIRKFQRSSLQYALAVASLMLIVAFMIAGFADTNFELIAPHYYLGITWALIIYQKYGDSYV